MGELLFPASTLGRLPCSSSLVELLFAAPEPRDWKGGQKKKFESDFFSLLFIFMLFFVSFLIDDT